MTTPDALGREISRHAHDKSDGCIGLVLTAILHDLSKAHILLHIVSTSLEQ